MSDASACLYTCRIYYGARSARARSTVRLLDLQLVLNVLDNIGLLHLGTFLVGIAVFAFTLLLAFKALLLFFRLLLLLFL